MFVASPPGLAFKMLKGMDAFVYVVCMNDEFCANEEEGSEFREVRENRVSCEPWKRAMSLEWGKIERLRENSVKRQFIIIIKRIFFI